MFRLYLRPIGDGSLYSDLATYLNAVPFPAPAGYEWMEGEPVEGAQLLVKLSPLAQLDAIFKSQPMTLQIAFSAMKGLAKDYGEVEDWVSVRKIINETPIPAELVDLANPIKAALLEVLYAL